MQLVITVETRRDLDPKAIAPTLAEAIEAELGMTFGVGDSGRDSLRVSIVSDGEVVADRRFDNLTDWAAEAA
jgi:hypothetical protein